MNTGRLRLLVRKLRTVPRRQFDYCQWAGEDWKGKKDLSCGTAACALGWATTLPSLRRVGLKLVMVPGCYPEVHFKREPDSFEAGAKAFDIAISDSYELFSPNEEGEEKATPKQVARKIERFIERELKRPAKERSRYRSFEKCVDEGA